MKPKNIDQRVNQQLAIGRYLRAMDRFEDASKDFNEACCHMRATLMTSDRFLAEYDGGRYVVTTTKDGDFDVEKLDLL